MDGIQIAGRAARMRAPRAAGLERARLVERLHGARHAMVIAPAGSGKTTLVAQSAAITDRELVWLSLAEADADPELLSSAIGQASGGRLCWHDGNWSILSIPLLVVIDDVHLVSGNAGAMRLRQLVERLGEEQHVVMAGRSIDPMLSEIVDGSADGRIICWDDLRFRVWEVDQLFSQHFGLRLDAGELPPLVRNTEGWATALHLFHVAAVLAPDQREKLVGQLRSESPALRRYLAEHVLGRLSSDELAIARELAAFDYLRRPVVELFGGYRAVGVLDRLGGLGLLTDVGIEGESHLHSLLREHLTEDFVATAGLGALLQLYRRCARTLDRLGYVDEAALGYLRSGRLPDAKRMQRSTDAPRAAHPAGSNDPWALWAEATAALRAGSLQKALEHLHAARDRFAQPPAALRQLESELASWLHPAPIPEPAHPLGALRRWLAGDDKADGALRASTGLPHAVHRMCVDALDGHAVASSTYAGVDRLAQIVAGLVAVFLECLGGKSGPSNDLQQVEVLLQTGGAAPSLERLLLALALVQSGNGDCEPRLDDLEEAARLADDELGVGIVAVLRCLHLGAPSEESLKAVGLGRLISLRSRQAAQSTRGATGSIMPTDQPPYVCVLGTLRIGSLGEGSTDHGLRPLHLTVLQSLALHSGVWLSRDQLSSWFWPDLPASKASHNLATALSSIRKALDRHAPESCIERTGDLYRLQPGRTTSDLGEMLSQLRSIEQRTQANLAKAVAELELLLDRLSAEILTSAPPSVWLDEARWHLQAQRERTVGAILDAAEVRAEKADRLDPHVAELLLPMMTLVEHSDALWQRAIRLARQTSSTLLVHELESRYRLLLQ